MSFTKEVWAIIARIGQIEMGHNGLLVKMKRAITPFGQREMVLNNPWPKRNGPEITALAKEKWVITPHFDQKETGHNALWPKSTGP
ncbi:MAG: hypothetical protein LBI10_11900 [Deltaproteobacteria bacterium]|jgi:hypothetical protein|nr:hypothetical protein [Deltaproteobacteria bacterium]